jgi:hypothetical protein
MSTPAVVPAYPRLGEQAELCPYDYRLYGAKAAGSTYQPAVFVDKKSGIQFSAIYLVFSLLLRVFYP